MTVLMGIWAGCEGQLGASSLLFCFVCLCALCVPVFDNSLCSTSSLASTLHAQKLPAACRVCQMSPGHRSSGQVETFAQTRRCTPASVNHTGMYSLPCCLCIVCSNAQVQCLLHGRSQSSTRSILDISLSALHLYSAAAFVFLCHAYYLLLALEPLLRWKRVLPARSQSTRAYPSCPYSRTADTVSSFMQATSAANTAWPCMVMQCSNCGSSLIISLTQTDRV